MIQESYEVFDYIPRANFQCNNTQIITDYLLNGTLFIFKIAVL
jgi:hypothetical protein